MVGGLGLFSVCFPIHFQEKMGRLSPSRWATGIIPLAHLKLGLFPTLFLDILMNCFLFQRNRIQRNEKLKILLGTPNTHPQKVLPTSVTSSMITEVPSEGGRVH